MCQKIKSMGQMYDRLKTQTCTNMVLVPVTKFYSRLPLRLGFFGVFIFFFTITYPFSLPLYIHLRRIATLF